MSYDIAIAMSTYFDPYSHVQDSEYRRNLFHQALESLSWVEWGRKRPLLVLRDDHSTRPPTRAEYVKAGMDVDFKVRPTHSEEMNANYWECIWDASRSAEWVFMMDDDGKVCSDVFRRLWKLVDLYPESKAYGSFNTHYHETLSQHEGYVLKRTLTELGMLFRSKDLTRKGTSLLATVLDGDFPPHFPCLAPSGMQHQGLYGLNNPLHDDMDPTFIYY